MAACKLNVTAELYSTDLRDVMAGATDISAPATIAFEIPSTNDCDEHALKISEIMAGVLEDFSPRGCENVEMDSFLLVDTQIPIFTFSDELDELVEADTLFGIGLPPISGPALKLEFGAG